MIPHHDYYEQIECIDLVSEFILDLKDRIGSKDSSWKTYAFEDWLNDMISSGYIIYGDDANYYKKL